jgi:hypothetical protein
MIYRTVLSYLYNDASYNSSPNSISEEFDVVAKRWNIFMVVRVACLLSMRQRVVGTNDSMVLS